MLYDYIIVGAGYGGLAAAALLCKKGYKVLVLEAHSRAGGCASYFKKGDFSFDVGATTVNGFSPGKPLDILARKLGLKKRMGKILYRAPIAMTIYQDEQVIERYSDINLWLKELKKNFATNVAVLEKFWRFVDETDKQAWKLLEANQRLMPSSFNDLADLFKIRTLETNLKGIGLIPGLYESLYNLFSRFNITESDLIRFIDEQLLITTQSPHYDCPWLPAIMGLNYASEVYYPEKSITAIADLLIESIKENGGEVAFRQEVKNIGFMNGRYMVTTDLETAAQSELSQSEFDTRGIVSNLPIWNNAEICEKSIAKFFKPYAEKFQNSWGAFSIYMAIQLDDNYKNIYHQIHLSKHIPFITSSSVFMTVSRYDDFERAPKGWRTVTISTHVDIYDWQFLDKEIYEERKNVVQEQILEEIYQVIPEFKEANKDFLESATPKSYESFTKRKFGYVGGIPHSVSCPAYNLPPNQVPKHNFYLVGDTTFPGQGIASVVYSALSVVNKIANTKDK